MLHLARQRLLESEDLIWLLQTDPWHLKNTIRTMLDTKRNKAVAVEATWTFIGT